MGAVLIAMFTHGWKKSSWRYLWAVPVIYLVIAGLEAVMAGSIVGLVLGAVYSAGYYEMNTWVPCTWGRTLRRDYQSHNILPWAGDQLRSVATTDTLRRHQGGHFALDSLHKKGYVLT
ncbi:hypothetical protein LZL87_008482 [Fusarium oxysporum]|nr:hypothetical protein LZL87_008482 [Fusarium oxysporum]